MEHLHVTRSHILQHVTYLECHNILIPFQYVYLRKYTVHSKYCSLHLSTNSFSARSQNSIHILSIISSSTHFSLSAGILRHVHQSWLLFAIFFAYYNNHPLLHWHFYSTNVSFHTHRRHNICIRGYTFCHASKNQSETGCLITIPCFSSRIPNSRSCKNCTDDIRTLMSLFCRLPRTYSTSSTLQSSHIFFNSVSLTILFTIFFNVCRVGTCCTRIYCTKALCNSCTIYRLAYRKNRFHALCDVIHSYIVNVSYTNHACCAYS